MLHPLPAGTALIALLLFAGCSDPEYSALGTNAAMGGRVNSAGPVQMLSPGTETFDTGRLASLVEAAAGTPPEGATSGDGAAALKRLDQALMNFANAPYAPGRDRATSQNRLRDARNTIQAQLIAASNNRCNVYKTHIRRLSSNVGFGLGGLATLAGAAGAIVTGPASQALAGAAGGLSGLNAEFQKDFFNGLVTSVIIPGIDRQRADLRNDMVRKSCASVTDYPLTLAISEAIRYHGACSADVGIAASGQAIARSSSDSLSTVLQASIKARKVADAATTLTNAEASRAAGNAAQLVTLRDTLAEQLADKDEAIKTATAGELPKLRRQRAALQRALATAKKQADFAVKANEARGSKTVDALTIEKDEAESAWDAGTKPLLGDRLDIVACGPLNADGQQTQAAH